ncbi:MAG: GGDEF domain-containing protein [Phycisphaerales bacterium]
MASPFAPIARTLRHASAVAARLPSALILAFGVALLALVATFDEWAGPHAPLALFYTLPIALVTWYVGTSWGLLFALFGGVAAFAYGFPSLPSQLPRFDLAMVLVTRVGSFAVVAALLASLRRVLDQQRNLANTDEMTSIANARAFRAAATQEIARMARSTEPLSAVFLDCDNFKMVNDRFGHAAGDDVLRSVAQTISANLRATDHVGRLGGDEFGILLPGLQAADAAVLVPKLRHRLLEVMHERGWPVTFSLGVRTFHRPPAGIDELLGAIDALQYRAKEAGKNRIMFESDTPTPASVPLAAAA